MCVSGFKLIVKIEEKQKNGVKQRGAFAPLENF